MKRRFSPDGTREYCIIKNTALVRQPRKRPEVRFLLSNPTDSIGFGFLSLFYPFVPNKRASKHASPVCFSTRLHPTTCPNPNRCLPSWRPEIRLAPAGPTRTPPALQLAAVLTVKHSPRTPRQQKQIGRQPGAERARHDRGNPQNERADSRTTRALVPGSHLRLA